VIEWMPRSRGDNGWSHLREGYSRRPAALEDIDGAPVVRVPVVVQNWVRAARRHAAYWLVLLARAAFFLAFAIIWSMRAATQRFGPVWPVVVAGGVVIVVAAVGAYRLVRLRRWPAPGRRADLLISGQGVGVGGLVVPWYQVERVVRFHLGAPSAPRRTRNFIALEVRDFVGVSGLSPMRAGLANLTRRRLVVLAERTELNHPDELAAALDRLVADPSARDLLSRPEGPRLVDEGPAMVIWRSS